MKKLLICTNYRANPNHPSCAARGSKQLLAQFSAKLQAHQQAIQLEESPCLGFCEIGPNARLAPGGEFFNSISSDQISGILQIAQQFKNS